MSVMKSVKIIFAITALLVGSIAVSAVPTTINYQGKLTDSGGVPITATPSITFSIYTASSGGSNIWVETQSGVSVVNGVFNVQLGAVTPISSAVLTQADLWLGINVAGDGEMTPRQKLSSTPFSLKSSAADIATALASNGANCSAGQYPLGVDASGNVEGCTVAGGGVTVMYSGHGGDITADQTKYFGISGVGATGVDITTFDTRILVVPVSCAAKNLFVRNYHWNSGTAGSHVVTLAKGSATTPSDTALTCTASNVGALNTMTTCSDSVHSVSVAAGEYLIMKVVSAGIAGGTENSGNAGASSISWGFTCE